jgi:hypothetical protein
MPAAPPDLEPLRRALAGCGIDASLIPRIIARLTNPPSSLHFSAGDDADSAALIKSVVGFCGDTAAMMLCIRHGGDDPDVTWENLTPAKKKEAKREYNWATGPETLAVARKGQPPRIDSALVLWCSRILVEASGGPHLKFTRPVGFSPTDEERSGPPVGRAWQALLAALEIAQASLNRLVPTATGYAGAKVQIGDPRHAEAIAQIVKLDRGPSKDRSARIFADRCRDFGLGTTADDVANAPQPFRLAVTVARTQRHKTRNRKPERTRHSKTVPD